MKRFLTIAAAALLTLGAASNAQAQQFDPGPVVSNWSQRFLGHAPDQQGMNYWAGQLASQAPQTVLGQMLASDEYLNRNGGTADGLVLGLYRDVLNRTQLMPQDVAYWVNKMTQYGSREAMIQEFLRDANVNVLALGGAVPPAAPAVAQPPVVVVTPAPAPAYIPPQRVYVPVPTSTHRWWGWANSRNSRYDDHHSGWFRYDRR